MWGGQEALLASTFEIARVSGKEIDISGKSSQATVDFLAVYCMACGGSNKVYMKKAGRGLHEQQIEQHRDASNAAGRAPSLLISISF